MKIFNIIKSLLPKEEMVKPYCFKSDGKWMVYDGENVSSIPNPERYNQHETKNAVFIKVEDIWILKEIKNGKTH